MRERGGPADRVCWNVQRAQHSSLEDVPELVSCESDSWLRGAEKIKPVSTIDDHVPKRDRGAFGLQRCILEMQNSVGPRELTTECAIQESPSSAYDRVGQVPNAAKHIEPKASD